MVKGLCRATTALPDVSHTRARLGEVGIKGVSYLSTTKTRVHALPGRLGAGEVVDTGDVEDFDMQPFEQDTFEKP